MVVARVATAKFNTARVVVQGSTWIMANVLGVRRVIVQGKGPREERETVVNWSEDSDMATIWTSSETVYRRMKKRGWFPSEDEERHAMFEVPKRLVRLPLNRPQKTRGKGFPPRKLALLEPDDEVA